MKLGFVSAILPELTLVEVMSTAKDIGYDCVEIMCWPKGKAERRYAGVTHIDVTDLSEADINDIKALQRKTGVTISALGYYPNPLVADEAVGQVYINHIYRLIDAAVALDINVVTTFVGRDHTKSVDANWPRFLEVWPDIVEYATDRKVYIGIENCPMSFTSDEWPGGLNLATTPAIWDRMYDDISSPYFGLNFDPSHYIIQHMDYVDTIKKYHDRFHHVHAKDACLDREALNRYGMFAHPNLWHTPKLPGKGDVDWKAFVDTLKEVGYDGAICVEVEDRDYEGSIEMRIKSLQESYDYLRPLISN